MRRRIAILHHEKDTDIDAYVISLFAAQWRHDGHEVLHLFGTRHFVPADIIIVHVDLSVVPERYLEYAARYPIALNGRFRDIRKSAFAVPELTRIDDWDGPVIVKSDANAAGAPERRLLPRPIRGVARRLDRMTSLFTARWRGPHLGSAGDYLIFEHRRLIPRAWLHLPRLMIQKFVPEREGSRYAVRNMSFLGDRVTCVRLLGRDPIVTGETSSTVEVVEPDPEMLALRDRLGADYGKFDYVMHDGRSLLLDANKTVGIAPDLLGSDALRSLRAYRAAGLYSYFR